MKEHIHGIIKKTIFPDSYSDDERKAKIAKEEEEMRKCKKCKALTDNFMDYTRIITMP